MKLTQEEKWAVGKFLVFLFVGLPLILMALPFVIATALMVGDVGGTAVINAIGRLFK